MIDTSALAFPKHPPARDKQYLSFVRSQICAVVGNECRGVTEAAHLEVAGKSLKASDYFTVPLCTRHHRDQHQLGIITFQVNHVISLWEIAARLLARWIEDRERFRGGGR